MNCERESKQELAERELLSIAIAQLLILSLSLSPQMLNLFFNFISTANQATLMLFTRPRWDKRARSWLQSCTSPSASAVQCSIWLE